QARTMEEGGVGPLQSGDEGTETELECRLSLEKLCAAEHVVPFELEATCETEGPLTRRRQALSLQLRASAEALPGPYGINRLRLMVENVKDWARPGAGREEVLAHSPVATHLLVGVTGGRFVSLVDPPEWARPAVAGCSNEHTWPVLVGSPAQDTVLSAPMVLPDFPQIAPESPTDLFDGTENDELLSLRIMTLTDEEKAEARATDARAPVAPTPRTCSSSGGRRPWPPCSSTWRTSRTWRSRSTTIRAPTSCAGTGATCTSSRGKWSPWRWARDLQDPGGGDRQHLLR